MIPSSEDAKALWNIYNLPPPKRLHVSLVAAVALFLARACQKRDTHIQIDKPLLLAGALLHDIDKAVSKLPGEMHPDTAVRILKKEGMEEVASLVKTHPLHAIMDPDIRPKSWEERLLYLADKMVKYEVITVDKRFALWNAERLPAEAQTMLDICYPKVKALEKEIFDRIGMNPSDVAQKISDNT